MSLEDVNQGAGVASTLSAGSWNAHNDAARAHQQGQRPINAFNPAPALGVPRRQGNVIKVRNNSGADVGQFGILGIDAFLQTPASDLDDPAMVQFRQQPWLDCITPAQADHWGAFVVLLDGIKAGQIGRAALAGVTVCKVDMKHADHLFADVDDTNADNLRSAGCGSARILRAESGTGVKWAIVDLLAQGRHLGDIEITGNTEVNAGKFKYDWREVVIQSDGTAETVTGGLSGTSEGSAYALNRQEINHTGTGIASGVDAAGDDYPAGFAPRPIGGGGTDNTHQLNLITQGELIRGRMWIDIPLSHDGTCASGGGV